jgi:type VI secretion system Hcp family effector
MAFRISVNIPGRALDSKGGQLFAMAYGTNAITPRNLIQMLSQMRSESAVNMGPLAGKRQHKPLSITKQVGGASPQLLNAHWTSETLQTATGSSPQKPISITKEVGGASPQLLNAHWTSEVLQSVVIQIHGPSSSQGGGGETLHHTISLTNAQIAGYTRNVRPPFNPGHGGSSRSQSLTNELEEFQLTFQKITYTNVFNSKSASDDWTSGK